MARLLLKDSLILGWDEAPCALDREVELAIQEQLLVWMEGKTVIAIAHRLSTIARMDRLIVLDEGRIVEQGSHHDLLQRKGHYARLWQHQSGGFLGHESIATDTATAPGAVAQATAEKHIEPMPGQGTADRTATTRRGERVVCA